MYRFTGLYDWVEHNDRRSLTLFLGFIVVFQLIALPTLLIFLAVLDPAHAPHHDFGAYALRYGSIVTFFGILAFVWAAWSHQRAVKRALPFAAVDPGAAPRLHRIFEPLAIVAGLPGARLAMLDSAALNAFAYGFARRNATVVVTRGLVDALNDDELGAVLAHELTHIRQGDVRFLIAANACIEAIRTLDRVNMDETKRASLKEHKLLRALVDRGVMTQARALALRDFAGGIVLVLLLPFLLIILLTLLFVRRQLLNLADAFRLLILSSREHIADAGAVAKLVGLLCLAIAAVPR